MPNTSLLIVSTHNAAQRVFSEESFKQQTSPSSDDEQVLQRQQPHTFVLAVVHNIAAEQMKFNSVMQQWGPFDWSLGGGERGQEHWETGQARSREAPQAARHSTSAQPHPKYDPIAVKEPRPQKVLRGPILSPCFFGPSSGTFGKIPLWLQASRNCSDEGIKPRGL
jgi:hypothetical protein